MTPKEKAQDLVERFYWTFGDGYMGEQHIQCALIAVDEIMKAVGVESYDQLTEEEQMYIHYWQQVKTEIENL